MIFNFKKGLKTKGDLFVSLQIYFSCFQVFESVYNSRHLQWNQWLTSMSANSHKSTMGVLAHGICMCMILLKLAKVERLKIRKKFGSINNWSVVSCHWLWPTPPRFSPWFPYFNGRVCKFPTILGSNDDYTIYSWCKPISIC